MSIHLISQNPPTVQKLQKLLLSYFPPPSPTPQPHPLQQPPSPHLYLQTKYYTCTITLSTTLTPLESLNLQQLQQNKIDLLVFVFDQNQTVVDVQGNVDRIVGGLGVQAVVVVDTEDMEAEWRYMGEIGQCENFVSVVYEDLDNVINKMPKWTSSSLLNQNQQDEIQIFSLFEMMQTTSWPNSKKKPQHTSKPHQYPKKQQKIQQQITSQSQPHTNPQTDPNKQQKQKISPQQQQKQQQQKDQMQEQEQEQEQDQQQLEKQMMEFELLMAEMMHVRELPAFGNERKKKAEDIIMKLTKSTYDC